MKDIDFKHKPIKGEIMRSIKKEIIAIALATVIAIDMTVIYGEFFAVAETEGK